MCWQLACPFVKESLRKLRTVKHILSSIIRICVPHFSNWWRASSTQFLCVYPYIHSTACMTWRPSCLMTWLLNSPTWSFFGLEIGDEMASRFWTSFHHRKVELSHFNSRVNHSSCMIWRMEAGFGNRRIHHELSQYSFSCRNDGHHLLILHDGRVRDLT